MLEAQIAMRIAGFRQGDEPFAFLLNDREVYFARFQPLPFQPETPATRLVSCLWSDFGATALRLVRRPIYTSYPSTEFERAFVRVAAKRLRMVPPINPSLNSSLEASPETSLETSPQHSPKESSMAFGDLKFIEFTTPPQAPDPFDVRTLMMTEPLPHGPLDTEAAMILASQIAASVPREGALPTLPRSVGAVLLDADGMVLGAAANTGGSDRTAHAEANLIRSWWQHSHAPLPIGSTIFCTLKPCKMCAALIWKAAQDPQSIRVKFRDWDHGPLAQATFLSDNGLEDQWPDRADNT